MSSDLIYDVGDWIVHNAYGVGQIKSIEKRPVHGEKVKTFKVKTKNATYWLPVQEADNSRIRRVVNKRKLRRAMRALRSKPEEMAENYKSRNAFIREVFQDGSFLKLARLLRDVLALREHKALNMTEKDAVEKITERFAREYAVCYDVPLTDARRKINETIQEI
jgi:CarD family transcriptional regulator